MTVSAVAGQVEQLAPGDPRGYREFLLAGVFAQTVVFGGTFTGYGMAEDMQKGVIDRFRTLPMHPGAVLAGRTLRAVVAARGAVVTVERAGGTLRALIARALVARRTVVARGTLGALVAGTLGAVAVGGTLGALAVRGALGALPVGGTRGTLRAVAVRGAGRALGAVAVGRTGGAVVVRRAVAVARTLGTAVAVRGTLRTGGLGLARGPVGAAVVTAGGTVARARGAVVRGPALLGGCRGGVSAVAAVTLALRALGGGGLVGLLAEVGHDAFRGLCIR